MRRQRASGTVISGTVIESRHERLGPTGTGTLPAPGPELRARQDRARANRATHGRCASDRCASALGGKYEDWSVEVITEANGVTYRMSVAVCSERCAHHWIAQDRARRGV